MRSLGAKTVIIGVALFVLSACSAVRLGYDNGPTLASWWLDGYLDLDRAQEVQARPAIERWFDWHRATQLPDYVRWLARLKTRADGPVSADEVCGWADEARARLNTAIEQAVPDAARLLPQLGPAQFRALERKQAERNDELRRDHLQATPAARLDAAFERALARAEEFYGPLTASQRTLLAEAAAASPLQPEVWLADRAQRQRALVLALRQAQQAGDEARRAALLRAAAERYAQPMDPRQAALQPRWLAHNCDTAARLHNTTTPAQRAHLRQRIDTWQEDLAALAARPAPSAAAQGL